MLNLNQNDTTTITELITSLEKLNISNDIKDQIVSTIAAHLPGEKISELLPDTFLTGSLPVDYLISPLNRNSRIHIYGPPSGGKTALIGHLCKLLEKHYNPTMLWIDTSFKLNPGFLNKTLDLKKMYLLPTADITIDLLNIVRTNKYSVIIIDDIASLTLSQNYSELMYICKVNKIFVIAANQIRTNPNIGSAYAAKSRILNDFDITLRIRKYSNGENHNLYNLYLEYYHQQSILTGESVILPINFDGKINEEKTVKAVNMLLKSKNYNSLEEMYAAIYPNNLEYNNPYKS